MESTMAAVVTRDYASPDSLELREVEIPAAEVDLVPAMVHAAAHCGELCSQTELAHQPNS